MDDSFFGATSQVRSITHNQTDFHWVNVGDIFFLCQSMKKELNTFGGNMKSMHLMGCCIFEEHLSWPILQTSLRQIICFFLRAEKSFSSRSCYRF